MDKSWMVSERNKKPYLDGVSKFAEFAVRNLKISYMERKHIPCHCIKCLNHKSLHVDEVQLHLLRYGIDQNYTRWLKHGEKDEPPISKLFEDNYAVSTDFTSGIPTDAADTVEMVEATEENFMDDHEHFTKLIEDTQKLLYEGCPNYTKLCVMVELINLKSKYGVSDKCFTEILVLVKKKAT